MTTNVVDIAGVKLFDTGLFNKDCSFPITDARRFAAPDEVMKMMPVFLGKWASGTIAPSILTHTMDVDTDPVTADPECGIAEVVGDMTYCDLEVPEMKAIALKSKNQTYESLLENYCRTRFVATERMETILNPDGTLNQGNPYAFDFGRFALAQVTQAMMSLLTRSVMNGDYSNDYEVDGFYPQLANGWVTPETGGCPDSINKAQVINWAALTTEGAGPYTDASPDAVTVASKTVTLWGQAYDVPVGLNLAQFIDDVWIPAVTSWWTDNLGGNVQWEIHVNIGRKRAFQRSAACIQPCNVSGDYDPELRERLADFISTGIVEFYPSRMRVPILGSGYVAADELWFGPRSINGRPTYGVFFKNLNEYFGMLGDWGRLYNQQWGAAPDDPLVPMARQFIRGNFEALAFHRYLNFQNILCVWAEMMTIHGVLATARHLWLRVQNVAMPGFYTAPATTVTIDGA